MGNHETELPIILELNSFANLCGHFFNAYLSDDISVNNGYNCDHEEQEETYDDETGKMVGCCYAHSCPLAYPADADDLYEHGVIGEDDYKGSKKREEETGNSGYYGDYEYMVVSDPATIAKLRELGITGLATK